MAGSLPDVTIGDAERALGICVTADAVTLEGGHLLGDRSWDELSRSWVELARRTGQNRSQ